MEHAGERPGPAPRQGDRAPINGYDAGTFNQGFDGCTRAACAESQFADLWVPQEAVSSGLGIP